jgi:hypothetical protein
MMPPTFQGPTTIRTILPIGKNPYVRLALFAENQAVELSSAGAYALVMPLTGLEEEDFWRPEIPEASG